MVVNKLYQRDGVLILNCLLKHCCSGPFAKRVMLCQAMIGSQTIQKIWLLHTYNIIYFYILTYITVGYKQYCNNFFL